MNNSQVAKKLKISRDSVVNCLKSGKDITEEKRKLGILEGKAKVVFADNFKMNEEKLPEDGLMRMPLEEKSNVLLKLPATEISMEKIRQIIRAERDED